MTIFLIDKIPTVYNLESLKVRRGVDRRRNRVQFEENEHSIVSEFESIIKKLYSNFENDSAMHDNDYKFYFQEYRFGQAGRLGERN
jgi:hypothetical protein